MSAKSEIRTRSVVVVSAIALSMVAPSFVPLGAAEFTRGDVDADGNLQLTDSIKIFSFLFLGGDRIECEDSADLDDSGAIDITDGIYGLNFLFLGGPAPLDPFSECGVDATEDALGCEVFDLCPSEQASGSSSTRAEDSPERAATTSAWRTGC